MNDKLFRKNAVDRVSSPEELGDYIRVTGPGVWALLLALALLLAGLTVWGFFGSVDVNSIAPNGEVITESVRPIDYLFG